MEDYRVWGYDSADYVWYPGVVVLRNEDEDGNGVSPTLVVMFADGTVDEMSGPRPRRWRRHPYDAPPHPMLPYH